MLSLSDSQSPGRDKGKGDGAGVNYGWGNFCWTGMLIAHLAHPILGLCRTGVGTSAAPKDNTKPKAHGGTGSSSIGGDNSIIAAA